MLGSVITKAFIMPKDNYRIGATILRDHGRARADGPVAVVEWLAGLMGLPEWAQGRDQ
jgi:hypothetical protein